MKSGSENASRVNEIWKYGHLGEGKTARSGQPRLDGEGKREAVVGQSKVALS